VKENERFSVRSPALHSPEEIKDGQLVRVVGVGLVSILSTVAPRNKDGTEGTRIVRYRILLDGAEVEVLSQPRVSAPAE
jgi:hypothetical protein